MRIILVLLMVSVSHSVSAQLKRKVVTLDTVVVSSEGYNKIFPSSIHTYQPVSKQIMYSCWGGPNTYFRFERPIPNISRYSPRPIIRDPFVSVRMIDTLYRLNFKKR